MTTFDKRDQGFENKFAHDEEMAFKVIARRNKLLGLWAAEKLGKKSGQAETYAREVALAAIEAGKNADLADKLHEDLKAAGLSVPIKEIRAEMERLLPLARKQVTGGEG